MAFKDDIINVIERGHQAELAFIRGLPQEERTVCGEPDHWCAKDLLAHNAFWKEHHALNILAVARGEEPRAIQDYEQANQECFQANRYHPCDDIVARSDSAHDLFMEVLQDLDEGALRSEETWPGREGRPVWQSLIGVAYTHPISHLAQYQAEHARGEQVTQLWTEAVELLRGLDDGPMWQGLMHYDMACMYSLAGDLDAAMEELPQAFELRPDLRQWSKQDNDLDALRERDDFKALFDE